MKTVARAAAAILALLLVASATGPAAAKKGEVVFPDGTWEGTAIWSGAISKGDVFASGTGKSAFTLEIQDGEVSGGKLTLEGTGQSKVPGGTGKLNVTMSLQLSGTASVVEGSGALDYSGTATVEGFGSVPVSGSFPAGGSFSPTFASCNKVTGDLATETRKAQQTQGFNTSVTAKFVAVRVAKKSAEVAEQYKEVADDIIGALDVVRAGSLPSTQQLVDLVDRIEMLSKSVHDSSPCPGVPPGFEMGQWDPVLVELFNQLILEILTKHEGKFTVHEIIQLEMLTMRIGLAEETENEFVDVLVARIDALVNELSGPAGDDPYEYWPKELKEIFEIYTIAVQLGQKELAAIAKNALGNFVEAVGGEEQPVEA